MMTDDLTSIRPNLPIPFAVSGTDREYLLFDWLRGLLLYADEHRVLVEPACGASLAAVYAAHPLLRGRDPVLVVVCGGAGVTRDQLARWDRDVPR